MNEFKHLGLILYRDESRGEMCKKILQGQRVVGFLGYDIGKDREKGGKNRSHDKIKRNK